MFGFGQKVVRAYNLKGEMYEMACSDLPSRVWQHEIDHLHGILFIDKMGPLGKLASNPVSGGYNRARRDRRRSTDGR